MSLECTTTRGAYDVAAATIGEGPSTRMPQEDVLSVRAGSDVRSRGNVVGRWTRGSRVEDGDGPGKVQTFTVPVRRGGGRADLDAVGL